MTLSFLVLLSMSILISKIGFKWSEAIHLFLLCGDILLKHGFEESPRGFQILSIVLELNKKRGGNKNLTEHRTAEGPYQGQRNL